MRWCVIGLAFVASSSACVESGSDGAHGALTVDASYPARPDSLAALAATARQTGGLVVLGMPLAPPVDVAPERALAVDGIYLEYPRAELDFAVRDALGASAAPDALHLCFPSGAARAVDAAGALRPDVLVLPTTAPPQLSRQEPSIGVQVVFLRPLASCMWVLWAADVVDGEVNGRGTVLGEAEPLEALRL